MIKKGEKIIIDLGSYYQQTGTVVSFTKDQTLFRINTATGMEVFSCQRIWDIKGNKLLDKKAQLIENSKKAMLIKPEKPAQKVKSIKPAQIKRHSGVQRLKFFTRPPTILKTINLLNGPLTIRQSFLVKNVGFLINKYALKIHRLPFLIFRFCGVKVSGQTFYAWMNGISKPGKRFRLNVVLSKFFNVRENNLVHIDISLLPVKEEAPEFLQRFIIERPPRKVRKAPKPYRIVLKKSINNEAVDIFKPYQTEPMNTPVIKDPEMSVFPSPLYGFKYPIDMLIKKHTSI